MPHSAKPQAHQLENPVSSERSSCDEVEGTLDLQSKGLGSEPGSVPYHLEISLRMCS